MRIVKQNVIFHHASTVVGGVSGILANVFIAATYGPEVLGQFNLYFALLILFSQVTVGGTQFSILNFNSQNAGNTNEVATILSSALVVVLVYNVIFSGTAILCLQLAAKFFSDTSLNQNFIYLLPAILFGSLNKVFLMALNGLNRIVEFATFSALRFMFILLGIAVYWNLEKDPQMLFTILCYSEGFFCAAVMVYTAKYATRLSLPSRTWIRKHRDFGARSFVGGVLAEVNTKADLLMVTFFLGYSSAGIYSFASMLAEGFSQLYTVLRNNVDPIVGEAYSAGDFNRIFSVISEVRRAYVPLVVCVGLVSIVAYSPVFKLIFQIDTQVVDASWPVYAILVGCYAAAGLYRPFFGMVAQISRPEILSLVVFFSVAFNCVINALLVPQIGIMGAALSTGVAFILESTLLYQYSVIKINQASR